MALVNVSELSGAGLDWAVFVARYRLIKPDMNIIDASTVGDVVFPRTVYLSYQAAYNEKVIWSPHNNWSQLGPLIEKYKIGLSKPVGEKLEWDCSCGSSWELGDTPLIAACRAIVASQLGDTVDVPGVLLHGGNE